MRARQVPAGAMQAAGWKVLHAWWDESSTVQCMTCEYPMATLYTDLGLLNALHLLLNKLLLLGQLPAALVQRRSPGRITGRRQLMTRCPGSS